MEHIGKSSKSVILFVMIGDIIVINLLFLLFQVFWLQVYHQAVFTGSLHSLLISFSASYLLSSYLTGCVLYHRRVRPDQIVLSSLKNMIGFVVIWMSITSISGSPIAYTPLFLCYFLFTTIVVIAIRLLFYSFIRLCRKRGKNSCNVLLMGSQTNIRELYEEMTCSLSAGYHVLGYFDTEPNPTFSKECPYLGGGEKVIPHLAQGGVHRVYCGLPSSQQDTILDVINYCENHLVRFYSVPNLRNYLRRRVTLEMFSNVPLLSMHSEPLSSAINRVVKRLFDILFSLAFLCTLFPFIYLVVAVIIKATSPGPILFKQRRNGINGNEFWCYKFRSMCINRDADTLQATANDVRKTKFGDFLRRSSIDELPQFINVLSGDMSVVGPRPHMLAHTTLYAEIINTYMVRHFIKPGITGWAQVSGFRGETKQLCEMQGRVKADIWYLEHWSFMLDLYIIYKTIANVLRQHDKRAY